ncbi:M20/M25/M40 family metallo-hydrolase [Bacteroidota bacterium]
MQKSSFYTIVLLLIFSSCSQYHVDQPEITKDELFSHIDILASDSLKGRKPGTPGGQAAGEYIKKQFKDLGLNLLSDKGFQDFDVVTNVMKGDNNSVSFLENSAVPDNDFVPLSISENGNLEAELCFVGYGFDIDEENIKWNDYEGIDVEGKWLLMLTVDPEIDSTDSKYQNYSGLRSKIILARDKNAGGVIFVDGEQMNPKDELKFNDRKQNSSGLPVIKMSRSYVNKLLETKGYTIEELEKYLNENRNPKSFNLGNKISISTDIQLSKVKTRNIIAMLPGNNEKLKEEYIVIGGHYDHIGLGGPGSGSRTDDEELVHNGADDNASGIAAIVEIAEYLTATRENISRSIIFVAFGAEEMGLVGSKYFIDNSPVDINSIKTMINIDMVGRLRENNGLPVSGIGSAKETEEIVKRINKSYNFQLALSSAGYGPSDHASFYGKDIPVISVTTGAHLDYHTPDDDIDRINFEGMLMVGKYISDLTIDIANRDSALSFQEAGPRTATSSRQNFEVTLGIMPDFVSTENIGLRVDFVTKGKPAEAGGMKKGDIITALNGMSVKNIYDYMARLNKLKAGETISVEILRNKKKEVLLIQL